MIDALRDAVVNDPTGLWRDVKSNESYGRGTVTLPCRNCATPTPFLASKLCDRCVGGSPQERVPTTK